MTNPHNPGQMKKRWPTATLKALTLLAGIQAVIIAAPAPVLSAASPLAAPTALRCEFLQNPAATQTATPRLSWCTTPESDHPPTLAISDQKSTPPLTHPPTSAAWQVLVASSPEKLQEGSADLWDSGRRASTNSVMVTYEGAPLQSEQTAWWTVRTWNNAGQPSGWAVPAQWTVGLLSPDDWKGEWIAARHESKPATSPIQSSVWIWSPESQDAKDTGTLHGKPAAGAVRYFRAKFDAPADADPLKSQVYVLADNHAQIYVNSTLIGEAHSSRDVAIFNIRKALHPGQQNLVTVRLENAGTTPNSAGLALTLEVATPTGAKRFNASDLHWESSRAPQGDGWPKEILDQANEQPDWQPARIIGPFGTSPWTKVHFGKPPLVPIFRRDFSIEKPVRRALIHLCGLGQYVLHLNGKKVGDHFLDPDWSMYKKTLYYNTFDITSQVATGANALGVMLGKGFYNTSGDRRIHGVYKDFPLMLRAQLNIEYADGSTTSVVTDSQWKWKAGPLVHNSILGGSDYDARRLPAGWDTANFNDSAWKTAIPATPVGGVLTAATAPPMKAFEEFKPVTIEEPKPGHFVYDFGQNCSAIPRITVRGKAGQTIKLTWAEQRDGQSPHTNNGKGLVNQSGIGNGYLTYTIGTSDKDEEWLPQLFYTGFQYLELTGGVPNGKPNPSNLPVVTDMTSVHVRSAEDRVGTFQCSNEMYNRIDRMIDWAVQSNLGHVLTDCPTREKMGWLEVPWLMWNSLASRYDMAAFNEKICKDIRDSQKPNGQILTMAPAWSSHKGDFDYTPEWGAAGVYLPWDGYQWYGDTRILSDNYDCMRRFVDYMQSTSKDLIAKPGLGDWYDYGHDKPLGPSQFTPRELTATAVFAGCADVVSSAAAVLGKSDDQQKYAKLAADIRTAFNREFHTGPGMYKNFGSPQTANAMAIVFNIVPASERAAAAQNIVADLEKRQWQQTSGDVGYRFLINALSETGHSDAIFKILNRDQIGSYAYLVNAGWTSLPEAWNAWEKSSMDHCMLGHIQEWFSQHLVGISQAENSIAFKQIVIQPTPGDGVTSASGTLDSVRGKIAAAWEQNGPAFSLDCTIPPGSTAIVKLPVAPETSIQLNNREAGKAKDIRHLPRSGDREIFEVGPGHYRFECSWP